MTSNETPANESNAERVKRLHIEDVARVRKDGKPCTVADLIRALSVLDPNLVVKTEGCDCIGYWSGEVEFSTLIVVIRRDDSRGNE